MDLSSLIPLLKLLQDSGAVSPVAPGPTPPTEPVTEAYDPGITTPITVDVPVFVPFTPLPSNGTLIDPDWFQPFWEDPDYDPDYWWLE